MDDLEAIFRGGESSFVEFKEEGVHPDSLAKEMAAFANTEGGTVFLGVADDGTPKGVSRPDIEEWVFHIARNNVKPALLPRFDRVEARGVTIARIAIRKDLAGPFSVAGKYYIRVGSTSRECTKEELGRLFQRSRYFYFEESPVPGSTADHIDRDRVREYFRQVYDLDVDGEEEGGFDTILRNAGILTPEGIPSVAGLVMFGKRDMSQVPPIPAVARFLPQAGVARASPERDLLSATHPSCVARLTTPGPRSMRRSSTARTSTGRRRSWSRRSRRRCSCASRGRRGSRA